MKKIKLINDRITITIDPNPTHQPEGILEMSFRKNGAVGRRIIPTTFEDLNDIVSAIKKFKRINWWEIDQEEKKPNGL